MSAATSGNDGFPACRCAHAGYKITTPPSARPLVEQPRGLHLQRLGDALEQRHRRRILLPLDRADVIAVDADAYCKFFLRRAAFMRATCWAPLRRGAA